MSPPPAGRLPIVASPIGALGDPSLRAHPAARGMGRHWRLPGQRQHAFHFAADMARWQQAGLLEHLDTAFSRGQRQSSAHCRYKMRMNLV